MAIDKIFSDANVDGIADNIFGAVNNSVSEVKQMQQRKAAENVQVVVEALKKIETNITEKFDNVTDVIEKRVLTIKDGRDGSSGSDGRNGRDGKPGRDGVNGKQGFPGPPGKDGVDGVDGVSVTDANIDFDGSLVLSLSSGQQINVGEIVPPELERQLVELRQGGSAGSSGDVAGPTSSTDNAIVRFDGTTGKLVQNSVVTIADTTGNMAGVGTLGAGAITATSLVSSGTAASSFTVTSGTAVPLTITNVGTGNSFVVEDSASTDATPFVIDGNGIVGIGTSTPASTFSLSAGLGILSTTAFSPQVVQRNKTNDTSASYFITQKDRASAIVVSGDTIGNILSQAYDGASYLNTTGIVSSAEGTVALTSVPGRLTFSTANTATPSVLTERMRIDSAGGVGIGGAAPADSLLGLLGTYKSSAAVTRVVRANGTIPSATTGTARIFSSEVSTEAAAFTLTNLQHLYATQSTIGAGSAVTNQFGFLAESTLTGAANNYGVYSNIASGTNRFNFYAAGTADNYFAGNLGLGLAPTTKLQVYGAGTTAAFYTNGDASGSTAYLQSSGGTAGDGGQILFGASQGVFAGIKGLLTNGTGPAGDLVFQTRTTSGNVIERMRISNAGLTSLTGTFSVTGVATFAAGTAALPSLTTTGDTNTGIYFPAADTLGFTTGGTERVRIDSAGNVGIGSNPFTAGTRVTIGGNATGATSAYGLINTQTIQTDVTSNGFGFATSVSTAASVTLSSLFHYLASQATFSGTSVTNQYGFSAQSNITGATNNYGYFSNIASGTNRFNFYANGTADNYFAGSVGIGTTPLVNYKLLLGGSLTGSANQASQATTMTIASDVTNSYRGYYSAVNTAASAFTLTNLAHFRADQGTIGATSVVTNQFGYTAESTLTGATNNYGFYSNITAGTNRYNFYAAGTADNYFAGSVGIGAVPTSAAKSNITSTSAGASTIALSLQNASNTVNSETVLDFVSNSNAAGVRSAQITAINTNGSTGVNMLFKIGNGAVATEAMRLDSAGNFIVSRGAVVGYQPSPAGISAAATLTNDNIQKQIISATGTTYTITMPLGTTLETLISWTAVDLGYSFSVINTATGIITMAVNTGVTSLGLLTIAAATSAQFRIRRTAVDTFILYRLA